MPGLYLHIPFCKKACHYCNFHFSTSLQSKDELLAALHRELALQRDYLGGQRLDTVYLGGGTPSLLSTAELVALFDAIERIYTVSEGAEITLEANPDDLDAEKVNDLRAYTPVNRLSIGIQSFRDEDLRWMNRAHQARESHACLERVAGAGFDNWTADLIYGLPGGSDRDWADNIRTLLDYGVPHISAYCLTIEEGTALHHFVKKGKEKPVDEETALRQFEYLMQALEAEGFQHYEISNFARPGRLSRHNSNYWLGEPYLGIGPSAHSYDIGSRQWNVGNNARYIRSLQENTVPFEREQITPVMRYNEYVMTRLRTHWGCLPDDIRAFGASFYEHFEREATQFAAQNLLQRDAQGAWQLTRSGKFRADGLAASLFMTE
ncbi:MAG: radical SAM family heme chaperone HemW [Saprospiraceae bacterium]|nr:radical SAM family heme chaperone HemW [Saprospiraceae bacterium]